MKIVIWIVTFVFAFILFLPLKTFYYYGETILKKKEIIISEKLESKVGGLLFKDAVIYVKGSDIVNFKKATVDFFLFYNRVVFNELEINSEKIAKLTVTYSVFNPLKVTVVSNELNATVHLFDRNLTLKSQLKTIGNINALSF